MTRSWVDALPAALSGRRREIDVPAIGRVSWYEDGPVARTGARPLLLVHSVNAAASAYEVKTLYDHYRTTRAVYAIDLPGYGFSDRAARSYTPRLMCDAIHALLALIAREQGGVAVDALAVSLGCEFLARVAVERPDWIASVALVSPTGFNGTTLREGPAGTSRGSAIALSVLYGRWYSRGVFSLLTRRGVIRYFLQRTFGSRRIDEGMLEYDYATTRPPGAEHAPLHFLSGFLFSADSGTLYRSLSQPVWVVHGVRGDFVNYTALEILNRAPNWSVVVMQTGALPHFEDLPAFLHQYDTWLAGASQDQPRAGVPVS